MAIVRAASSVLQCTSRCSLHRTLENNVGSQLQGQYYFLLFPGLLHLRLSSSSSFNILTAQRGPCLILWTTSSHSGNSPTLHHLNREEKDNEDWPRIRLLQGLTQHVSY